MLTLRIGKLIMVIHVNRIRYPNLDSAELKWRRGLNFYLEAQNIIDKYLASKFWDYTADGRYSEHYYGIVITENIPADAMMAIGDAVHNLRSCLDHCAFQFWLDDASKKNPPKTPDSRVHFPIGKDRQSFEKYVRNLDYEVDAEYAFQEMEAFPGGAGSQLSIISDLDNIDKHRLLTSSSLNITVTGAVIRRNAGPSIPASETILPPTTLWANSAERYTSLIDRMGRFVYGYANFPPIAARENKQLDTSNAKLDFTINLAGKHGPIGDIRKIMPILIDAARNVYEKCWFVASNRIRASGMTDTI